MEDNRLLAYEAPQVITYTDEEILEELGQAHAYGRPAHRPPVQSRNQASLPVRLPLAIF
jgi:hypothetical protein